MREREALWREIRGERYVLAREQRTGEAKRSAIDAMGERERCGEKERCGEHRGHYVNRASALVNDS